MILDDVHRGILKNRKRKRIWPWSWFRSWQDVWPWSQRCWFACGQLKPPDVSRWCDANGASRS